MPSSTYPQHPADPAFLARRAPIRRIPDRFSSLIRIHTIGITHAWAECGPQDGPVLIFAHGLMGNLFNCADFFAYFANLGYRMLMPFLPMYDLPLEQTTVAALGQYLEHFIRDLHLNSLVLIGNSTGGAAGVSWAATQPDTLEALILVGSSGLSDKPLQQMTIRRNDWQFMYENMQSITINRNSVQPAMIDDVFAATRNPEMAIRVVRLARSVVNDQLPAEAGRINCPTLLCWGDSDIVTPPEAAHEFHRRIRQAELVWFEDCGHLPQMEQPERFCRVLRRFLKKLNHLP